MHSFKIHESIPTTDVFKVQFLDRKINWVKG
jgi:hypothetical protein